MAAPERSNAILPGGGPGRLVHGRRGTRAAPSFANTPYRPTSRPDQGAGSGCLARLRRLTTSCFRRPRTGGAGPARAIPAKVRADAHVCARARSSVLVMGRVASVTCQGGAAGSLCHLHRRVRQREIECRAYAELRFEPDPSTVALDDLFGYREADAAALIFPALVQPLKHLENAVSKLLIDADSIVLDREQPFPVARRRVQPDPWRPCGAEFQGVADQVLQQLPQLGLIGVHHRQRSEGNVGVGFLDSWAQLLDHLANHGGRLRGLQRSRPT